MADGNCTAHFTPGQNDAIVGVIMFGATLSMLGSGFIIASYVCFPRLRTFPYRLIMWLSVADFVSSFSYLLGISKDLDSCTENGRCTFAALLNQFFGVASFVWTAVVAYNCYAVLVQQKGRAVEGYAMKYHAVAWGLPLLLTIIAGSTGSLGDAGKQVAAAPPARSRGPMRAPDPRPPALRGSSPCCVLRCSASAPLRRDRSSSLGPHPSSLSSQLLRPPVCLTTLPLPLRPCCNSWCWIKEDHELARFFCYYAELILIMALVSVVYFKVGQSVQGSAQVSTINFRLRLYLFVFLGIRSFAVLNRTPPPESTHSAAVPSQAEAQELHRPESAQPYTLQAVPANQRRGSAYGPAPTSPTNSSVQQSQRSCQSGTHE